MNQRDIVAFNFVRRQSETSLMSCYKQNGDASDHNANISNKNEARSRASVGRSFTFTSRDPGVTSQRNTAVNRRVTLPERFQRRIRRKNNIPNFRITDGSITISTPSSPKSYGDNSPSYDATRKLVTHSPGGSPVYDVTKKLPHSSSGSSLTSIDELANDDEVTEVGLDSMDWEDRKHDMQRAIEWLKQEVLRLREQDRVLVKRFMDLHTLIKQKHGVRSCPSLVSTVIARSNASLARSNASLANASWLSLDDASFNLPRHRHRIEHSHADQILMEIKQRSSSNQMHKLARTHSGNLNTCLSDTDLHVRNTVSLSDITVSPKISHISRYARFDSRASLAEAESLDEDSGEEEFESDTLTKTPKGKSVTSDTLNVFGNGSLADSSSMSEDSLEEIFTLAYTDTLTKAPSFEDSDSDYDCNTLTKSDSQDKLAKNESRA